MVELGADTHDEHGGFFDHVPPPAACPPTCGAENAEFERPGIRVPVIVISPYARLHDVSHRTHSHTSNRDANSDALLDLFDFSHASAPPVPASIPAAAASRCP